jgi:hypothetical protein
MPLPAPDAGISNLNATMPCTTRRWAFKQDPAAVAATYNWFPFNGQYIDTPAGPTAKWTSDADVHLLT